VFLVALRLGLTSFGGPVAHLGYFRREYVERRHWLDEARYAELVGLCQFLPGPASSELGIAIGLTRAGLAGGLAAWLGFTLPSAIALTLFATVVRRGGLLAPGPFHGLQIAAVAVVAQALWSMARALAPDRARGTVAIGAAVAALLVPTPATQVAIIAAAALLGWRVLAVTPVTQATLTVRVDRRLATGAGVLFLALLLGLPLVRHLVPAQPIALVDSFYRAGALVFGGGHVVLPLLQAAVVPPGWVSNAQFLAGYGAAQAVPGPLFTFAAYLGAVERPDPHGALGAALALIAIFLPGFLLVVATLPLWGTLRGRPAVGAALRGVNAAVVGLLLAALYNPVWTSAIRRPADAALAMVAFALLALWAAPPWLVVTFTVVGGALVAHV
jgi:chromate transporter